MKDNMTEPYLERLQIDGLWGHYDIDWQFHPDVNILVGENGTGKSTMMRLLAAGLSDAYLIIKKGLFETLKITFDGDVYMANDVVGQMSTRGASSGFWKYRIEVKKPQGIHVDYINTFDNLLENDTESPSPKTNLDQELDAVTRKYLAYHYQQSNKVFTKQINFEEAFAQKTYLFATLNRLFSTTGKTVDEQHGELEFLLNHTERIKRQDLSSGEKQLLILLLTVLCQEEQPAILLMDEPEISLHLRWQYELIDIIRHLNPHCQVIIATHSPSIFNDGWRDKVFWMENLIKNPVAA